MHTALPCPASRSSGCRWQFDPIASRSPRAIERSADFSGISSLRVGFAGLGARIPLRAWIPLRIRASGAHALGLTGRPWRASSEEPGPLKRETLSPLACRRETEGDADVTADELTLGDCHPEVNRIPTVGELCLLRLGTVTSTSPAPAGRSRSVRGEALTVRSRIARAVARDRVPKTSGAKAAIRPVRIARRAP